MNKIHFLVFLCLYQLLTLQTAAAVIIQLCNAELVTAQNTLNSESPRVTPSEEAFNYDPPSKKFTVKSLRIPNDTDSKRTFQYKLKGSLRANGTPQLDELALVDINIEGGTIRGWQSMVIDGIWMMHKASEGLNEIGNTLPYFPLGRDFPKRIAHRAVKNKKLLPLIKGIMENSNSKIVIIEPDNPHFATITQKIGGKSHNGTQTVNFINSINTNHATNHSIAKIEIQAESYWYNLIFHIDNIFAITG